jgi:hypothetical protein
MSASRISAPDAREALDTLAARLEAAERGWRDCEKRNSTLWQELNGLHADALNAEREVKRLRDLCERIADVLPDPMHPAFPREFVDKQVTGVVLLDAALAEEK